MPTKEEIEKALGNVPPEEYPRDLYTATRAEFVTRVRTNQPKKKGCPLALLTLLATFGMFGLGVYWVYTGIILKAASLYMWMLSF